MANNETNGKNEKELKFESGKNEKEFKFEGGKNEKEFKFEDRIDKDSFIYDHDRKDTPDAKDLKEFSFKQKLSYFFEYYIKFVIIFVVAIIGIISCFIALNDNIDRKKAFTIVLMDNIRFSIDDEKEFKKDYVKALLENDKYKSDIKNKTKEIYVYNYTNDITDNAKFIGLYDKSRFDVAFTKDEAFNTFAAAKRLKDLREVLTDEQLEKYKDNIVYVINEKNEKVPYGIIIGDTKYPVRDAATKNGDIADKAIFCVMKNSKKSGEVKYFVDYFLG